jgi:hypothetical protein
MLVQTLFLCIGITYLSLLLSDLFISNLLSSNNALVFQLGQNLSIIPKFMLLETKNFTYLTSIENKDFRSKTFNYSYLYQSTEHTYLTSFLQKFPLLPFLGHKNIRIMVLFFSITLFSCISDLFSYRSDLSSSCTKLRRSSRILHAKAQIYAQSLLSFMMNLCTELLLL